ncbi:MAG: VOC family protein [bacterium]
MQAVELGHAVFYVRNLEASLRFYRDTLGFKVIGGAFGGKAAALVGGAHRTHHELLLIEVGDLPGPAPRRRGLYHIGIKIGESKAELKAAIADLRKAGVTVDGASDHTVSWSLYLHDPDGNEVELYCDNPGVDWRKNPELAMAPIKALDLGP